MVSILLLVLVPMLCSTHNFATEQALPKVRHWRTPKLSSLSVLTCESFALVVRKTRLAHMAIHHLVDLLQIVLEEVHVDVANVNADVHLLLC